MIAAGGHLNAIAANGRQLASQTCEDAQRVSQRLLLRCWKMQMQHDTNEEGVPKAPEPQGHTTNQCVLKPANYVLQPVNCVLTPVN